jgi:hypothetical protein
MLRRPALGLTIRNPLTNLLVAVEIHTPDEKLKGGAGDNGYAADTGPADSEASGREVYSSCGEAGAQFPIGRRLCCL